MKKTIYLLAFILGFFSCENKKTAEQQDTTSNTVVSNTNTIDFSKYTFNTIDGLKETIVLKPENIYILDFWYLECVPCRKDHKVIAKYADDIKKDNIEIIGMSIDRNRKKWKDYLDKHNYNWKNYNQFSFKNALYKDLKITFFPTYIIVNSKGEILHKAGRFIEAFNYIKSIKKS